MQTVKSIVDCIGNTPMIRLRGPSAQTGCEIYAKMEFLNPGGSIKDRTALGLIRSAEKSGELKPGGVIVEGTAGNTGIGLTVIGNALGYRTEIFMPETQSKEKINALRIYGAEIHLVPAVPYKNPENYVHVSQRFAEKTKAEHNNAFWANQFDNTANGDFHYKTTGVEIWDQTDGEVDGFVFAAGTGGTISGVGRALKERKPNVTIALSDPTGSGLFSYYEHGEFKIVGNSITEGIGNSRLTNNMAQAPIDRAYQIPDEESLPWVYDLLKHEGICVGGSSGVNVAGAVRLAKELGPGHLIVTMLCDYGTRYQGKLFNREFLVSKNLPVPDWLK